MIPENSQPVGDPKELIKLAESHRGSFETLVKELIAETECRLPKIEVPDGPTFVERLKNENPEKRSKKRAKKTKRSQKTPPGLPCAYEVFDVLYAGIVGPPPALDRLFSKLIDKSSKDGIAGKSFAEWQVLDISDRFWQNPGHSASFRPVKGDHFLQDVGVLVKHKKSGFIALIRLVVHFRIGANILEYPLFEVLSLEGRFQNEDHKNLVKKHLKAHETLYTSILKKDRDIVAKISQGLEESSSFRLTSDMEHALRRALPRFLLPPGKLKELKPKVKPIKGPPPSYSVIHSEAYEFWREDKHAAHFLERVMKSKSDSDEGE